MARTITRTRVLGGSKSSWDQSRTHRGTPRPLSNISTTTRVLRSQSSIVVQTAPNIKTGKGAEPTKRRKRLDPWYPKRKVNQNPKPRPPPPTHFTCRICISRLPSSDFIRWVPPRRARFGRDLDAPFLCIPHLARNPSRRHIDPVCKMCVGSFMAARLDTLGARQVSIGCLEPDCMTVWPWDLVIKYFPSDKLEAYNLSMLDVWKTDSELFTCLSTICNDVGIIDATAPGYPQIQCNVCSLRQCASCMTPWHTDQTCTEVSAVAINAQMSDPEKATLELMQAKDGKRCPNCYLVIEKDGGCPSMFCPSCKKYFNWETAASAVPGTKKALPVANRQGYWQTPGMVACEMDRLDGKVTDVVEAVNNGRVLDDFYLDQFLMDMLPDGFGANPQPVLPLPDEDNMDL